MSRAIELTGAVFPILVPEDWRNDFPVTEIPIDELVSDWMNPGLFVDGTGRVIDTGPYTWC